MSAGPTTRLIGSVARGQSPPNEVGGAQLDVVIELGTDLRLDVVAM